MLLSGVLDASSLRAYYDVFGSAVRFVQSFPPNTSALFFPKSFDRSVTKLLERT